MNPASGPLTGLTEAQAFIASQPFTLTAREVVAAAKKAKLTISEPHVYGVRKKLRDATNGATNHAGDPVHLKTETNGQATNGSTNGHAAPPAPEHREDPTVNAPASDEERARWHAVARSVQLQANEVERDHLILVDRMHARERFVVSAMTPAELRFHRRQEYLLTKIVEWRREEAQGLRELAAFATGLV